MRILLGLAVASLTCLGTAHAGDPEACNTGQPAARILACSEMIEASGGKSEAPALAHFNRGIARAQTGEYKGAVSDFTAAIEARPEFSQAFNNRANSWSALRNFDEAIRDYSRALALDPTHLGARVNRGLTYAQAGNAGLAVEDLTDAIGQAPGEAKLYVIRATLLRGSGDTDAAERDLAKALELEPTNQQALAMSRRPTF